MLVENSGICYSAWIVAALHKKVAGYKLDKTYIGVGPFHYPDNADKTNTTSTVTNTPARNQQNDDHAEDATDLDLELNHEELEVGDESQSMSVSISIQK